MLKRIFTLFLFMFAFAALGGLSAYITLTLLIKGEDTVRVPDLVQKDVVYALQTLSDLGLNTRVGEAQYSSGVAANYVLSQRPKPGTEIKKGRDVEISLSKGPRIIRMPKLTGLSRRQADIVLEQNGLCKGTESFLHEDRMGKDRVLSHYPPAGRMVGREECVDVLISQGKHAHDYLMPDLTGLYLDDAILRIEKSRLVLGRVQTRLAKRKSGEVVLKQSPAAGERVIEGSGVSLVVNRPQGKSTLQTPLRSAGIGLFRHRTDPGFLKRHIRIQLNCFGIQTDIFDDYMTPGEDLWLAIPRGRDAAVLVYEDDIMVRSQVY